MLSKRHNNYFRCGLFWAHGFYFFMWIPCAFFIVFHRNGSVRHFPSGGCGRCWLPVLVEISAFQSPFLFLLMKNGALHGLRAPYQKWYIQSNDRTSTLFFWWLLRVTTDFPFKSTLWKIRCFLTFETYTFSLSKNSF